MTSGLLAALILNLAVFDDLRTDRTADLAGTVLAPQHRTSILACLLALQWLGLALILASSAFVIRATRPRASHTTTPQTA